MKTQKIFLSALGVVLILGLGFLFLKLNSQTKEEGGADNSTTQGSQQSTENPADSLTEFGKPVVFKINDEFTFSDGLKVVLKKIDDSRCPEGVQCIWAGELSAVLTVSLGKLSKNQEIHVGTMVNKTLAIENYTFSLKDVTENTATVLVEYTNK